MVLKESLDDLVKWILEAFVAQVLEEDREILHNAQPKTPFFVLLAAHNNRNHMLLDILGTKNLVKRLQSLNEPYPHSYIFVFEELVYNTDSNAQKLILLNGCQERQ